jgi:hypothetical protein
MKLPVLSVATVCLPFLFVSSGLCQQNQQPERPYIAHSESPRLYFSWMPTEHAGFIELSASDAQLSFSPDANLTSADIGSVLQLRGDVRVRLCAPSGHGCEKGSLLLQAEAVDYNERTREIDAHGDVRILPDSSSSLH